MTHHSDQYVCLGGRGERTLMFPEGRDVDNEDDTPGIYEFVIHEIHESGLVYSLRVASERQMLLTLNLFQVQYCNIETPVMEHLIF